MCSSVRVMVRHWARWTAGFAVLSSVACGTGPCVAIGGGGPIVTGGGAVAGDIVLLNEVLFNPAGDAASYVELKTGNGGPPLVGLRLVNQDGVEVALPETLVDAGPGSLVLILFDGTAGAAGGLAHSDQTQFLNPSKGRVSLLDSDGNLLDQISWDAADPDSASLDVGGVQPDVLVGQVLARPPKSVLASAPADWNLLESSFQTPGQPNPDPTLTILLPMDGTTLPSGDVELNWYPVPGAAAYHVQLGTDAEFTSLLIDKTIDLGPVIQTLPAGAYFWRLQAVSAGGDLSDFTEASGFEIVDDMGLADIPEAGEPGDTTKAIVSAAAVAPGLRLSGVPLYKQRKDTNLLLLESDKDSEDPQAFNKPHPLGPVKQNELADFYNCGFACISMANGYYARVNNINRPNLSQDRISYQVYSDPAVFGAYKGPEWDFNYGYGLPWGSARKAIEWALGSGVAVDEKGMTRPVNTPNEHDVFWERVQDGIAAKNPVIITIQYPSGGTHAMLVVGWTERNGVRTLIIHDPGTTRVVYQSLDAMTIVYYWPIAHVSRANVRKDEPGIWTDTDHDGVYDFDEEMRFHTDKNSVDSDGDCLSDFIEIRRSVLDPKHGWGTYWSARKRRESPRSDGKARPDTDGDGMPCELDDDSDGGGLPDFVEDQDYNLEVDPSAGEGNPFDRTDDYRKITGTYRFINNVMTDTSSYPNYAYDQTGVDKELTADFTLEAKSEGGAPKLKGTAMVHTTKTFYYIHRMPIPPCNATRRDGYGPDRMWTAALDGRFTCYPGQNGAPHTVQFDCTASPDGKLVPDQDIYLPSCPPGDPLVQPTLGLDLSGFGAIWKPVKGLSHMESSPNSLQPNQTGQLQSTLECTIQRP